MSRRCRHTLQPIILARNEPKQIRIIDSRTAARPAARYSSCPLRGVHGIVRPAQKVRGTGRRAGDATDADTGTDLHEVLCNDCRGRHCADEPIGKVGGFGQRKLSEYHEFMSTESAHQGRAGFSSQPTGDVDQELVSGLMSQGVVDCFEAVEVNQQHDRFRIWVALSVDDAFGGAVECCPAGQPCQLVVESLVLQSAGENPVLRQEPAVVFQGCELPHGDKDQ